MLIESSNWFIIMKKRYGSMVGLGDLKDGGKIQFTTGILSVFTADLQLELKLIHWDFTLWFTSYFLHVMVQYFLCITELKPQSHLNTFGINWEANFESTPLMSKSFHRILDQIEFSAVPFKSQIITHWKVSLFSYFRETLTGYIRIIYLLDVLCRFGSMDLASWSSTSIIYLLPVNENHPHNLMMQWCSQSNA